MVCSYCGGDVTWRGPWSNMTHTECGNCGRRNCQMVEAEDDEEEDDYDWASPTDKGAQ